MERTALAVASILTGIVLVSCAAPTAVNENAKPQQPGYAAPLERWSGGRNAILEGLPLRVPPACPVGVAVDESGEGMEERTWTCQSPDDQLEGPKIELVDFGWGYTVRETHFSSGQRQGPSRYWYANGTKGVEAAYKANLLDGAYVAWDASGQKRAECIYEADVVAPATHKAWGADGKPLEPGECRTQDDVGKTMSTVLGAAQHCYDDEHEKNPELAGIVVTSFVIDAMGIPRDVTVTENTMGPTPMMACLTRALELLRYAPALCCGTTDVTYPWEFEPGGGH